MSPLYRPAGRLQHRVDAGHEALRRDAVIQARAPATQLGGVDGAGGQGFVLELPALHDDLGQCRLGGPQRPDLDLHVPGPPSMQW